MNECEFCGESVSVEGEDELLLCVECDGQIHPSCMEAHLLECTGAETSLYGDSDD